MVSTADTSFLFSLYGNDDHTDKAIKWLRDHTCVLTLTTLNEFELGNALRFAEFKSFLPSGKAESYWEDFLEDKRQGRVITEKCNLSHVVEEANRLSSLWTLAAGHRSFDILHVASGVILHATHFLTFDQNQARLARKLGMTVPKEFG
ncbi:MAG: PIN domain-containing protein [Kiritimatiellae bacterium]|jgi:predicted nucleic acid-binding protein|nr:PIN domain-containing protein [Kiritimatiellia bacterium]